MKKLTASNSSFTSPYILQLLGEYVIAIIGLIYKNRENLNKENLVYHTSRNPEHYEKIRHYAYNYWDCYYRRTYPKFKRGTIPKGDCDLDHPRIKMV
ncbi:hypothetical protein VAZ01S_048_00360 [Vibrio azureus NBRC 104587]|uniref:Uncharacterized protein n=1 Tax=Vibrio azureus NBRC 104587 TaxID=1219077 RepID=U3C5D3_9VIBR|nr:hypothetical protein VAZ01S_048_00360 [Vibrio azureus NBRC 104587]